MNDDSQPTNGELLQAILALHAFTEAGLQRLDSRIDRLDVKFELKIEALDTNFALKTEGLDNKIERLRYDMNKRFDHVDERFDRVGIELDEIKSRVTRLEGRPT